MARRDDRACVLDVRDAAASIQAFVHGLERARFLGDDEKQSAVLLKLIVMGEATKRLSMDYRNRHPELPWSGIAGMRDRLVHGYDEWDLEQVWKVVTVEIPPLVTQLERLVQSFGPPPG